MTQYSLSTLFAVLHSSARYVTFYIVNSKTNAIVRHPLHCSMCINRNKFVNIDLDVSILVLCSAVTGLAIANNLTRYEKRKTVYHNSDQTVG